MKIGLTGPVVGLGGYLAVAADTVSRDLDDHAAPNEYSVHELGRVRQAVVRE